MSIPTQGVTSFFALKQVGYKARIRLRSNDLNILGIEIRAANLRTGQPLGMAVHEGKVRASLMAGILRKA